MPRAQSWPASDGRNYGIRFVCPGCKADGKMEHHTVCTEQGFDRTPWNFDGNLERPTFTPSLLCRYNWWNEARQASDAVVCHSFVTDGRIQFLSDCTHSLAGQMVDLPEIET